MSLAIVYSRASMGVQAPLVTIEVHLSNGKPNFTLVGLPEKTVKEAQDRVRSALLNAEFKYPAKRITVNLAPADLPKEGGRFDLPIAIGMLAASGYIDAEKLKQFEFIGELALTGQLRAVHGVIPATLAAKKQNENVLSLMAMLMRPHWSPIKKRILPIHYLKLCNFSIIKGNCLWQRT